MKQAENRETGKIVWSRPVIRHGADGSVREEEKKILSEHPLLIRVNGTPVLRLICTGKDLKELCIGRLYTEQIIDGISDVEEILFDEKKQTADVRLRPEVILEQNLERTAGLPLKRKEPRGTRMLPEPAWKPEWVFALAAAQEDCTPLHAETRSTHCGILISRGEMLAVREDISRHNAVDKAIGCGVMQGVDLSECILATSGRVPADMVQKAVGAGIPVLVSKSIPTENALELAKQCGIRLVCLAREDSYTLF